MERVNVYKYLPDGGRERDGWFDLDAATEIVKEATRWNGNDHVSVHTVDQFAHQRLIRTKSGRWVRHDWSQWQGSEDRYAFITDDEAREWLNVNESYDIVERHFGAETEEEGPPVNRGGRPEIGGLIPATRLGDALLARLEKEVAHVGTSRNETIRKLLTEALDARDRARN